MTLPENPSGRDLAAFADQLQSMANDRQSNILASAAIKLNDAANALFIEEARQAIAEATHDAAESVTCLQQPENYEAQREGAKVTTRAPTGNTLTLLQRDLSGCYPGAAGEVAEHGFIAESVGTLQVPESLPTITINIHGVTHPEAVAVAVAESMQRQLHRRTIV